VTVSGTQGKDVALVVRHEDEREAVAALLEDLGMNVHHAQSGQSAIFFLEDHKADFLVMDAKLEDMHAWQMLGILKESVDVFSLPTVIIADEQMGMPLTNVTVVVRPVSVAKLRQVIFGIFAN